MESEPNPYEYSEPPATPEGGHTTEPDQQNLPVERDIDRLENEGGLIVDAD